MPSHIFDYVLFFTVNATAIEPLLIISDS
uniref:Uncharacterized protein n=1 Tax=Rhizophora mucronata TaxID=61149 RepID=A0A2P2NRA5_RHIMU